MKIAVLFPSENRIDIIDAPDSVSDNVQDFLIEIGYPKRGYMWMSSPANIPIRKKTYVYGECCDYVETSCEEEY